MGETANPCSKYLIHLYGPMIMVACVTLGGTCYDIYSNVVWGYWNPVLCEEV